MLAYHLSLNSHVIMQTKIEEFHPVEIALSTTRENISTFLKKLVYLTSL